MDRINQILEDREYQNYLAGNEEAERGRIFCRHDMGHFLDVARLAMLLNVEERLGIDREMIYAAALLHDIGRHQQYANGTPHEKAGAALAPPILDRCGFTGAEKSELISAIRSHRDTLAAKEPTLGGLLYRADKMSRSCFACKAEPFCDWKNEKKNRKLWL